MLMGINDHWERHQGSQQETGAVSRAPCAPTGFDSFGQEVPWWSQHVLLLHTDGENQGCPQGEESKDQEKQGCPQGEASMDGKIPGCPQGEALMDRENQGYPQREGPEVPSGGGGIRGSCQMCSTGAPQVLPGFSRPLKGCRTPSY